MVARIGSDGDNVRAYTLLSALDRLTSAAMWVVAHQTNGQKSISTGGSSTRSAPRRGPKAAPEAFGLRGAVSIVLATFPLLAGVPRAVDVSA